MPGARKTDENGNRDRWGNLVVTESEDKRINAFLSATGTNYRSYLKSKIEELIKPGLLKDLDEWEKANPDGAAKVKTSTGQTHEGKRGKTEVASVRGGKRLKVVEEEEVIPTEETVEGEDDAANILNEIIANENGEDSEDEIVVSDEPAATDVENLAPAKVEETKEPEPPKVNPVAEAFSDASIKKNQEAAKKAVETPVSTAKDEAPAKKAKRSSLVAA